MKFEFSIGQTVFHAVANDSGIIVARKVYEDASGKTIFYYVSIGLGTNVWCEEEVLRETKNVI